MDEQSSLLTQAIAEHRAGRLSEAGAHYEDILRQAPEQPDALHFLGMLRFQQGQPVQAIELLKRSLEAAPDNAYAWNNLGNMMVAGQRLELAVEVYRRATSLEPRLTEAWHNLGTCLRHSREPEEAARCFQKAIELNPRYVPSYECFGMLLYRLNRIKDSAVLYRRWLEFDPENPVAQHMAAATSGEAVPDRAGDAYVASLFDKTASFFDQNLAALGYRAPQLLVAALGDHVQFQSGRLDILDAGCGTGLCGPLLRSTARTLIGVDLSSGMIEKARERKVYDQLVVGELCAFMRSQPAKFDVVLSADTLCYFGALEEPLAAAKACLRPNGILAFTVEALEGEHEGAGFRIEPHGRYVHTSPYIAECLRKAGFSVVALDAVALRRELRKDVIGHLAIGRAGA
ncbi:MAG TPA: tetratricopeptide repeat protein [Steroidobacteraceae bacterium]|nr:tetratricopeptide repeat protein [Steroidobacteraceae bacterium]